MSKSVHPSKFQSQVPTHLVSQATTQAPIPVRISPTIQVSTQSIREYKQDSQSQQVPIKKRYPSYTDAVRDLDDCLSLIFLFSVLPKSRRVYVEKVQLCLKLSLEFMHYVIASKSLRKCFISIKGYYFQADIKGHKVTWIMPHKLAYQVIN